MKLFYLFDLFQTRNVVVYTCDYEMMNPKLKTRLMIPIKHV